MRKEITRIFKDSTVYGLGSLLPRAAAIILTPIYTTYLSPKDYGIYSFALMLATMTGVIMMVGQPGSLTLFYRRTVGDPHERGSLAFTVFWFVMAFAGVLLGIGFLVGPKIAPVITGSKEIPFYPYLAIALLIAFTNAPQALQQAVNRGLGQAKTFTAFQLSAWAINTGFTLYFVVALREGAYGSLKGSLAAPLLIMPVAIFVLVRRWEPRFSMALLKRSLRFGLPLVPHYFAGWMLTFFDRYLLMRLSTATQVGLYSLAYSFGMIFNLFCNAISTAWQPIYYDLADTAEGKIKLPRLITVYCAAIAGLAIVFTFFAPNLLVVLANPRFHSAAPVVPVIAGGYFFFALYMIVSTPIFHARRTALMPVISSSAAAVNVLFNLVLIPRFGIMGAAWATFAAYLCMASASRFACWRLKRNVFENRKMLAVIAIYLLAMAAALALTALSPPLWIDLPVKLALLPVFFGLLIAARVATWRELKDFVRRRPQRSTKTRSSEDESAELKRSTEEAAASPDDTGFTPGDQC